MHAYLHYVLCVLRVTIKPSLSRNLDTSALNLILISNGVKKIRAKEEKGD